MFLFAQQQLDQAQRLGRLGVETQCHRDAGAAFKFLEYLFRIDGIMRAIHDQRRGTSGPKHVQAAQEQDGRQQHPGRQAESGRRLRARFFLRIHAREYRSSF